MKKDTKQRILEAARHLFNDHGYSNVRLYQIAERATMSIGNMAYHYKHKVEILLAIFSQLQEKQRLLLDDIQVAPIFENFDQFTYSTYNLQIHYLFFYLDTLELIRTSTELMQQYRDYLSFQEMHIDLLLQLNQARGVLDWDVELSSKDLGQQLRRTMDSWHYMQLVEGKTTADFKAYRKAIWSELSPYFTEQGEKEFRQLQHELLPQ